MTTIAIDKDTISADGRVSWNGIIAQDDCVKVKKIDGVIFAWMGDEASALSLLEYVRGATQEVAADLDGYVLSIGDGEVLHHCVKGGVYTADTVNIPYAFGSGQHFALSALDMGKTSKEAVKYAMTRDPSTGGKITTLKWGE